MEANRKVCRFALPAIMFAIRGVELKFMMRIPSTLFVAFLVCLCCRHILTWLGTSYNRNHHSSWYGSSYARIQPSLYIASRPLHSNRRKIMGPGHSLWPRFRGADISKFRDLATKLDGPYKVRSSQCCGIFKLTHRLSQSRMETKGCRIPEAPQLRPPQSSPSHARREDVSYAY